MSNTEQAMNRPVPTEARTCFVILETQYDEHGYIPSLVTEGESGHQPLTGRGEHSTPWYWGDTYDAASEVCKKMNSDRGISERDAAEIVGSSMFG